MLHIYKVGICIQYTKNSQGGLLILATYYNIVTDRGALKKKRTRKIKYDTYG